MKTNFCFQTVIVWRYCNQPREMRTLISYPDLTLSLEISHFQWQSEIWVRDYENTGLWGCRKLCFLDLRLINFMFLQTVPWKSRTKETVSLIWLWKPLVLQNSLWDEEIFFCIGFSKPWPSLPLQVHRCVTLVPNMKSDTSQWLVNPLSSHHYDLIGQLSIRRSC